MTLRAAFLLTIFLLFSPFGALAQEAEPDPYIPDVEIIAKARVLEVTGTQAATLPGTNVEDDSQTLVVEILEGSEKGVRATFENDFTQLEVGDVFYARHIVSADGSEMWSVSDPYRLPVLLALAAVFLVLLLLFGGSQGIRGLASLIGSLFLIFYLLLPGIYGGHSPILISIGVSSLIILVGSYITHGFNRATSSAVLGMIATVVVTGLAAYWAVHAGNLSGFTTETNAYLNFSTDGRINMVGLLFGGIMIGLLGVLYDIAIGQAVAIDELYRAQPALTRVEAYRRGLRIGREHIGALVNTLAIAYVGASLPLLLLLQQSNVSIAYVLNGEVFATEIVRILIGSIGLILAVPLTTFIASRMLYGIAAHSH
ncbi:MAG: hypothetical protein QOE22_484 [Candidatus Parcubacteria bacterium]|jgi:uncharacterized membrane protein|nr:hypothetical protein [Candidatus Parcubacteria bacterium]